MQITDYQAIMNVDNIKIRNILDDFVIAGNDVNYVRVGSVDDWTAEQHFRVRNEATLGQWTVNAAKVVDSCNRSCDFYLRIRLY